MYVCDRFGRQCALGLPLAYVYALALRDEAQYLQHYVTQERPNQSLAALRVRQRHVQPYEIYAFLLRQHAPLA